MPSIIDIETAFPSYKYTQSQLTESLKKIWAKKVKNTKRLQSIQENVLVEKRSLSLPIEEYFNGLSFGERNNRFIETACNLLEEATLKLLQKNNFEPEQISGLWSNTVTGFAIPSLESRLMNRIPFKKNTKRVPLMGLGCMAGVAGINRVHDYLLAYPTEAVLFLSVECCSLTFQTEDISVANLVSTGLFGDGAAVVLMVGDQHPKAQLAPLKTIANESIFFSDTQDVMGWNVSETGLKIILNKNVPDVVRNNLVGPLEEFKKKNDLTSQNISTYFAHPGGPKVLQAMEEVLGLPEKGLKHSWESLRENGNMSSVSVLDIFKRHIDEYLKSPRDLKGTKAMSLAMGPAFSAELGLLQWN
jgi:alkylresorcinol/alkylpyrone synthase